MTMRMFAVLFPAAMVAGQRLAAADGSAVLAERGQSGYVAVVPDDASDETKFAALELTNFLHQVTGAVYPLVGETDAAAQGAHTLEVGTARARTLAKKKLADAGDEAYVTAVFGGRVILAGNGARGTAYAVYDFLENKVGCRWLTTWGESYLPQRPDLSFAPFAKKGKPAFAYRWILGLDPQASNTPDGSAFLFRMGLNLADRGCFDNVRPWIRPDEKGRLQAALQVHEPWCHTLFEYIPPFDTKTRKGYFKDHPEFFTLEAKTNRRSSEKQLCFTNPDLRKELTKNFLEHVAAKGGEGVFDLSAMDTPGTICGCANCQALEKKYGCIGAPFFDYLAELGREMEKSYPKALLRTLLYRKEQTQVPPNVAFPGFPKNVCGVFADIGNDFSKDYNHPNNVTHREDLKEWGRQLRHLWTWYYPIAYGGGTPFSGIRRFAVDTRVNLESGVEGVTYEHNVGVREGLNNADMQTYVLLHLYRDPSADAWALAREFARLYYGPAAEDVMTYVDALETEREKSDKHLVWSSRIDGMFTPTNLTRWQAVFDAAERKAGDDALLRQRLRECRAGLDLMTLRNYRQIRKEALSYAEKPEAVRDRALAACAEGVRRRYPGKPENNIFYIRMKNQLGEAYLMATLDPKPLPAQFAGIAAEDLIDVIARPGGGSRSVLDPDAAAGVAICDEKWLASDLKQVPHRFGFYDDLIGKQVLNSSIATEQIVPDRYHFYKLGKVRLTSSCRVWMGYSWRLSDPLGLYWKPGTDDEWDVYVSIKFGGKGFSPASTQEKNVFRHDRTVLVRVKK